MTAYFFNPNIHPCSEYEKRLGTFVKYCDENGIDYEIGYYDMESYFFEIAPSALALSREMTVEEFYRLSGNENVFVDYSQRFTWLAGSGSYPSFAHFRSATWRGLTLSLNLTEDIAGPGNLSHSASGRGQEHSNQRCAICYQLRLEETALKARELGIGLFSTTLLVSPYQDAGLIRSAGADSAIKHGVLFIGDDLTDGYYKSVEESKRLGLYRQKYCGCVFSEKERLYKRDMHKAGQF